jgi:hypothetical protein
MNRAAANIFFGMNLLLNYFPLFLLSMMFLDFAWPILVFASIGGGVWAGFARRAIRRGQRSTILWAILHEALFALSWILLALGPLVRDPVDRSFAWAAAPGVGLMVLLCAFGIYCLFRCHVDPDSSWRGTWLLDGWGLVTTILPFGSMIALVCGEPFVLGLVWGLPQMLLVLLFALSSLG